MSDAKKKHGALVYGRTSGGDNKEVLVDSNGVVQVSGVGGSTVVTSVPGTLFTRDGTEAPVASLFRRTAVVGAAVQATTTQAAAGLGNRNVCTGFTFTFVSGSAAPAAAAPLIVSIIDGISGGGTYLWQSYINIPAVAGAQATLMRTGLWLPGSQNTALTIEFSAAGGASTYQSVSLEGVIITE